MHMNKNTNVSCQDQDSIHFVVKLYTYINCSSTACQMCVCTKYTHFKGSPDLKYYNSEETNLPLGSAI